MIQIHTPASQKNSKDTDVWVTSILADSAVHELLEIDKQNSA